MEGERIEQFLKTVASYAQGLREGSRGAEALQRHEDSMVVWIIGLAAGAVIAVPALLGHVINLRSIPRWALALSLGPFVLAVLVGVAYRLILAKFMEADVLFGFKKIHALESLKFRGFEGAQGLDQLGREVFTIMDDKSDILAQLKRNLDKIKGYADYLSYWPYILFALGVIGAAALVVIGEG